MKKRSISSRLLKTGAVVLGCLGLGGLFSSTENKAYAAEDDLFKIEQKAVRGETYSKPLDDVFKPGYVDEKAAKEGWIRWKDTASFYYQLGIYSTDGEEYTDIDMTLKGKLKPEGVYNVLTFESLPGQEWATNLPTRWVELNKSLYEIGDQRPYTGVILNTPVYYVYSNCGANVRDTTKYPSSVPALLESGAIENGYKTDMSFEVFIKSAKKKDGTVVEVNQTVSLKNPFATESNGSGALRLSVQVSKLPFKNAPTFNLTVDDEESRISLGTGGYPKASMVSDANQSFIVSDPGSQNFYPNTLGKAQSKLALKFVTGANESQAYKDAVTRLGPQRSVGDLRLNAKVEDIPEDVPFIKSIRLGEHVYSVGDGRKRYASVSDNWTLTGSRVVPTTSSDWTVNVSEGSDSFVSAEEVSRLSQSLRSGLKGTSDYVRFGPSVTVDPKVLPDTLSPGFSDQLQSLTASVDVSFESVTIELNPELSKYGVDMSGLEKGVEDAKSRKSAVGETTYYRTTVPRYTTGEIPQIKDFPPTPVQPALTFINGAEAPVSAYPPNSNTLRANGLQLTRGELLQARYTGPLGANGKLSGFVYALAGQDSKGDSLNRYSIQPGMSTISNGPFNSAIEASAQRVKESPIFRSAFSTTLLTGTTSNTFFPNETSEAVPIAYGVGPSSDVSYTDWYSAAYQSRDTAQSTNFVYNNVSWFDVDDKGSPIPHKGSLRGTGDSDGAPQSESVRVSKTTTTLADGRVWEKWASYWVTPTIDASYLITWNPEYAQLSKDSKLSLTGSDSTGKLASIKWGVRKVQRYPISELVKDTDRDYVWYDFDEVKEDVSLLSTVSAVKFDYFNGYGCFLRQWSISNMILGHRFGHTDSRGDQFGATIRLVKGTLTYPEQPEVSVTDLNTGKKQTVPYKAAYSVPLEDGSPNFSDELDMTKFKKTADGRSEIERFQRVDKTYLNTPYLTTLAVNKPVYMPTLQLGDHPLELIDPVTNLPYGYDAETKPYGDAQAWPILSTVDIYKFRQKYYVSDLEYWDEKNKDVTELYVYYRLPKCVLDGSVTVNGLSIMDDWLSSNDWDNFYTLKVPISFVPRLNDVVFEIEFQVKSPNPSASSTIYIGGNGNAYSYEAVDADASLNIEQAKLEDWRVTFEKPMSLSIAKFGDNLSVQEGKDVSYTVIVANNLMTNEKNLYSMDVLPLHKDERGTILSNTAPLKSIVATDVKTGAVLDADLIQFYYSDKQYTVSETNTPNDIYEKNKSDFSTVLKNSTKTMVAHINEIGAGQAYCIQLTFDGSKLKDGDVLVNDAVLSSSDKVFVKSQYAPVIIEEWDRSIAGSIFWDNDYKGYFDDVPDYVTSEVTAKLLKKGEDGTFVEEASQKVTNGRYEFKGLDAGDYQVSFKPADDKAIVTKTTKDGAVLNRNVVGKDFSTGTITIGSANKVKVKGINLGLINKPVFAIKKSVWDSDAKGTDLNGGDVHVGDTMYYEIEVSNNVAHSLFESVVVRDKLPKGLTLVPGSISVIKADGTKESLPDTSIANGVLTTPDFGILRYGEKLVIGFSVTVTDKADDSLVNTAYADGTFGGEDFDGEDETEQALKANMLKIHLSYGVVSADKKTIQPTLTPVTLMGDDQAYPVLTWQNHGAKQPLNPKQNVWYSEFYLPASSKLSILDALSMGEVNGVVSVSAEKGDGVGHLNSYNFVKDDAQLSAVNGVYDVDGVQELYINIDSVKEKDTWTEVSTVDGLPESFGAGWTLQSN